MHTRTVSSEAVAEFKPYVEYLAKLYVGRSGAEFDDLVQEGLIMVWQSLGRGLKPSTDAIKHRMSDWTRYLHRLQRNDAIAYERILPIEAYGDW